MINNIGVVGAGAMGSGIAQVAAMSGCTVYLYDQNADALSKGLATIDQSLNKLLSKGKISPEDRAGIFGRIYTIEKIETLKNVDLIIEAIIEDTTIKQTVFKQLESVVNEDCILATNTSSLSVTALASCLENPERFIGIHFFNPPILMNLVEIVPAIQTSPNIIDKVTKIISNWGKTIVIAKDTPGFIVNKVARPFYSEAIRILDEGIADIRTIDFTMKSNGFRMGPFELMDFIGHDVNYKVTESVWRGYYFHPRYKPSLTQLKLVEASYLGKKSGRGFYDYTKATHEDDSYQTLDNQQVFMRIIAMLINEAADTIYYGVCSEEDLEKAVLLGVNYPKGLLQWGREIGYNTIVTLLDELYATYKDERYAVSLYLRNLTD